MILLGQIQQKAFDVLKDDSLPLDSLLAAISTVFVTDQCQKPIFGTIIGTRSLTSTTTC